MARLRPAWRAAAVVWRAHAARARLRLLAAARQPLVLVVLGLGGALAGGALVGEWCLGLVMVAEGALVAYVGFARDDGAGPLPAHEAPTVGQVLERARLLP